MLPATASSMQECAGVHINHQPNRQTILPPVLFTSQLQTFAAAGV
jgi:hypothetical protein